MSQPNIRAKILSEDPVKQVHYSHSYIESCLHKCFDLVLQLIIHLRLKNRFQLWPKNLGVSPQEMAYDILLENQGRGFIYAP